MTATAQPIFATGGSLPSGQSLPMIGRTDGSGNYATAVEHWVMTSGGLFIPAPTDSNANPVSSPVSNRVTTELTSTALAASGAYTQSWQDAQALGVNYIHGSVVADQSGTLYLDLADDQNHIANTIILISFTPTTAGTANGQPLPNPFTISTRYFRFRYVNGSTAQGTFELFQTPMAMLSPRDINAQLTGSNTTLANNVTTATAQLGQSIGSAYSQLRLNVWATGTSPTFDVQVQGQMYDGSWYTLQASNSVTGATVGTDITTQGVYDYDVSSWQQVRLNVVSISGTSAAVFAQGGLHQ